MLTIRYSSVYISFKLSILFFITIVPLISTAKSSADKLIQFNIQAIEARKSLPIFASQADLNFAIDLKLIESVTTQRISGLYSAEQALNLILQNSSISARISQSGTIIIEQKAEHQTEIIQIKGYRESITASFNQKRYADSLVDVINAEDIGRYPDQNIAESLQRITGVSIERIAGEGSKISVRGFGPEFNTVLWNNRIIPTSNNNRSFSFEQLASDMVSSLIVYKSSRASHQEGSIGSLVNMLPNKPLQRKGLHATGSIEAAYDSLSEQTTPSISGLISNNVNDEFGVLASFNFDNRVARIDSANVGGYRQDNVVFSLNPNDPASDEKYWRPQSASFNYDVQDRTRIGGTLMTQWRPDKSLTLTADALLLSFDIDSDETKLTRWFSNPIYNAVADDNGTITSFSRPPKPLISQGVYQLWNQGEQLGTGQWNTIIKTANDDKINTNMLGFNVDWAISNNHQLEFDAHTSQSKSDTGNTPRTTLANPNQKTTSFSLNDNSFTWPSSEQFIGQPDNYYANNVEFLRTTNKDSITALNLNIESDLKRLNYVTGIKYGSHWSKRLKSPKFAISPQPSVRNAFNNFKYNIPANLFTEFSPGGGLFENKSGSLSSWYEYNPMDLVDFFLSEDVQSQVDNIGEQIITNYQNGDPTYASLSEAEQAAEQSMQIAHDKITFAQSVNSDSEPLKAFTPVASHHRTWEITENITALYAELLLEGDNWQGNIGGRYIKTNIQSSSSTHLIQSVYLESSTGTGTLNINEEEQIKLKHSYSQFLPALNIKMDINEDIVLRSAYYKSSTRPLLEDLIPREIYEGVLTANSATGDIDFNGTIQSKNITLKPYTADNLDISLEWYIDDNSYLSLVYFYKDIKNWIILERSSRIIEKPYIVDDLDNGLIKLAFEETKPVNKETSDARGFEVSYLKNFDSGFGVQLNYTHMDSTAEFDPSKEEVSFTLDGLSNDAYNLTTFYEDNDFHIRFSYNWRSDYVNCATCGLSGQPVQTSAYGQLDGLISYNFAPTYTIRLEAVNLTNEIVQQYSVYKNRFLDYQETGVRLNLSLTAHF